MLLLRGEEQIKRALALAQEAAERNRDKEDWRDVAVWDLWFGFHREVKELGRALMSGDMHNLAEELGDCLWYLVMIADRRGILSLPRYEPRLGRMELDE